MKKFFSSFFLVLLVLLISIPVLAEVPEYIYPDNLVVEGNRSFVLKISSEGTSLSAYTFPDLVLLRTITLPEGTSWATLTKEGIVTYFPSYQDSQKEEIINGKKRIYWLTTVTNHLSTYDLNLDFKSNLDLVSEYRYDLNDFSMNYLDVPAVKSNNANKKKKSKKQKYKKLSSGRLQLVK